MEPRKSAQGISDEDCERIDVEFPKLFYVSSMDAVKKVIQNYELRTKSQFAAHRETKNFATNWSIFSGKVVWLYPFRYKNFKKKKKFTLECTV